jgi:peptidoglycan/xylan/chitin deacetylase (PgdA/CDA1 family)
VESRRRMSSRVTETAARGGRDAALAAMLALAAYAAPSLSVPAGRFPGIVTRLPRPNDTVALTFDDGPHPRGTPAVLEALDRSGARATFFVVGAAVRRHRGLLAEILSAGHEIALHGDRHRPHVLMLPRSVRRDLERGQAEIEQQAGVAITALRAPYGAASLATLAYARRRGLTVAGWTRWGWDWRAAATADSIATAATRSLGGGEVILLHDSDAYSAPGSWRATAAAVPLICTRLERAGLVAAPFRDVNATPGD